LKAYLAKVVVILGKDLLAELRTWEVLSSMLVFALLVTVVFSFALDPQAAEAEDLAPGLLWVAFAFAGILGFNRSFALEKDGNSLQGLMLAPLDRSGIYVAKMLGNLIFLSLVEAIVVPLYWVLHNMSAFPWPLALIFPLATVGFVAAGTLCSAMTAGTRARDVLLPILLLPISVPLIVAAVKATGTVLIQQSVAAAAGWIRLLVACDVVFLVLSVLTFEYVIEE
jgi:heme exporter protein B